MKFIQKFLLLLFFIPLFSIGFYFISQLSFSDTSWPTEDRTRFSLEYNHPLMQKFVANRNNLSKIKIYFSDTTLKSENYLHLKLMDENCLVTLREEELSNIKLDSDDPLLFSFDKIKESKNKIFCISVAFISNTGNKKAKVYLIENPPPSSISLYSASQQSEIENKALSMRPVYVNNNLWQDISELDQRISQYKPFFLKKYYLASIAGAFLILSFALVIILIIL